MAFTLLQQLLVFLFIILLGYLIVKFKKVKTEDSRLFSVISIYFVMPCAVLKAFQIHMTPEIFHGMMLALVVSIIIHLLFWVMIIIGKRVDHWNSVEMASVMYPNCGNLILPIIPVLFGDEWVIYASMYLVVQNVFFWTHCVSLFEKKAKFDLAKVVKNPNILAIMVGTILCVMDIRLPNVAATVCNSFAAMLAPAAMLTIGMLLASLDIRTVLKKLRTYEMLVLRLLVCPLLALVLIKITHAGSFVENGDTILLITMLGCMGPPAASITQVAQLYGDDAEYASSLNTICLLACVLTMPLIVAIYTAWPW